MSHVDFEEAHHCPLCGCDEMQVLMPIWITPGAQDIDVDQINYESSMCQDSNNWYCPSCNEHHFPRELDE